MVAPDPRRNPFNITSDVTRERLSDKGAKDYAKATGSIEKASKAGGLTALVDLFTSIIDISDNPLLQVLMKFFEVLSAFFNAGAAEAAKELAESLFSEESIENMEEMSDSVNSFFKGVLLVTGAMRDAKIVTDAWGVSIDNWGEDMEKWRVETGKTVDAWADNMERWRIDTGNAVDSWGEDMERWRQDFWAGIESALYGVRDRFRVFIHDIGDDIIDWFEDTFT